MEELRPRLVDQVRDAIRLKHDSYRTELAYVRWSSCTIYYQDARHRFEMDTPEDGLCQC